jgi:predicted RNA-binding Zn-ribbon protein involved in translation (DUF1610 family)
MAAERHHTTKAGRTFDSAYSFSFSIAVGLVLFIAGLIISLTFGNENTIGLIFGIPLLIAGLVLPLIMMRGLFTKNELSDVCPYCSVPIKTAETTFRLECPACGRVSAVRNGRLKAIEE